MESQTRIERAKDDHFFMCKQNLILFFKNLFVYENKYF